MTSSTPYHEGVPQPRRSKSDRRDAVRQALVDSASYLTVAEIADAVGCAAITVRRHLKTYSDLGILRVHYRPRVDVTGAVIPSRGPNEYTIVENAVSKGHSPAA